MSISPYLHLLPGAEALPLPACDGTLNIGVNSNRFIFDPAFYELKDDRVTSPICVRVCEEVVNQGAGYISMLELLGGRHDQFEKLTLTQHQIMTFREKYYDWLLKDQHGTWFLLGEKNGLGIVKICAQTNWRDTILYGKLDTSEEWPLLGRRRFVFPVF